MELDVFLYSKDKRVLITEKHNDDEKQIGRHKGKDIITSKGSKTEIPHFKHTYTHAHTMNNRSVRSFHVCFRHPSELHIRCELSPAHFLFGRGAEGFSVFVNTFSRRDGLHMKWYQLQLLITCERP